MRAMPCPLTDPMESQVSSIMVLKYHYTSFRGAMDRISFEVFLKEFLLDSTGLDRSMIHVVFMV